LIILFYDSEHCEYAEIKIKGKPEDKADIILLILINKN
jgi:hypothetical protein